MKYHFKKTMYSSGKKKISFFKDIKKSRVWIPLVAIALAVVLLVTLLILILRDGSRVVLTEVVIAHEQVPESFDGYKILQISDLLGTEFGDRQAKIKKLLKDVEYDMILFTGDFFKSPEETDYWAVRDLMECLDTDVPIYYIVGDNDYVPANAPSNSNKWKMCINPPKKTDFMKFFEENYGAEFIYPAQKITSDEGESIYLTGIEYDKDVLNGMDFDQDKDFSICVTHKPINYNVTRRLKDVNKRTFTEIDYDVSISGHTLGGQYRLPVLGAVYDDETGLFPEEDDVYGLSSDGNGRLNYVCGGLGVEKGLRIFCTPEISLIELRTATEAAE
jgi:predicted MPP superfamily phosphohydrolase